MLIEILVSVLVLTIAATGAFTLMSATTRSAAQERQRTQAYAVAQEDQTRLRSLRLSELNGVKQENDVTVSGATYHVVSTASFVNAKSSATSCANGENSADYVKVFSTVTWPNMGSQSPVTIASIISPASSSLDPTRGTLTVSATNAAGNPIPGIRVDGVGPATFSATTDANGCAMFVDQPEGNYTLTPSGVAAGLVDKDGKVPGPVKVGITGGTTVPYQMLFDLPGKIREVAFRTKNAKGEFAPSSADSVVVSNIGMTSPRTFGTPGGTRFSMFTATPTFSSLFPFQTADTVYAGSCSGNNPNPSGETNPPGAAAMGSALIPPGGVYEPQILLTLPALYLTVKSGSLLVSGAKVTVSDVNCTVSGNPVKREYTTTPEGTLASPLDPERIKEDPGLPWGTYNVCASARISGSNRRKFAEKVAVQNLTSGTPLTLDLSGTGSEGGSCP